MKEYHALEIYEMSKHAPPRVWYRSDLYATREKAKKAFLDIETYEAFTALHCIQGAEDPPFQFDGEYEDIDDYAKAYEDGVPEIVEIIDNLLAWVKEEKEKWTEEHWIEHGIQNFNVHEAAEKAKNCKGTDHQAKLELIYQTLQELVDDTEEFCELAKRGARELKDYGLGVCINYCCKIFSSMLYYATILIGRYFYQQSIHSRTIYVFNRKNA